MAPTMNIGQAAKAAGASAKMIRHHEQIGLLPEAARSDAGYRRYGEREVAVLRYIRQSRDRSQRAAAATIRTARFSTTWQPRARARPGPGRSVPHPACPVAPRATGWRGRVRPPRRPTSI